MSYIIKYHEFAVKKDIPKLPKNKRNSIKKNIITKLAQRPEIFGKPLQNTLKGYWRLRIGDYRIIFKIKGNTVYILIIAHRSTVYINVFKRLQYTSFK